MAIRGYTDTGITMEVFLSLLFHLFLILIFFENSCFCRFMGMHKISNQQKEVKKKRKERKDWKRFLRIWKRGNYEFWVKKRIIFMFQYYFLHCFQTNFIPQMDSPSLCEWGETLRQQIKNESKSKIKIYLFVFPSFFLGFFGSVEFWPVNFSLFLDSPLFSLSLSCAVWVAHFVIGLYSSHSQLYIPFPKWLMVMM